MPSATCRPWSSSMSAITTLAPSRANIRAVAHAGCRTGNDSDLTRESHSTSFLPKRC
jgi:hypothetical protein